jgi:hypothetical protein
MGRMRKGGEYNSGGSRIQREGRVFMIASPEIISSGKIDAVERAQRREQRS